jgi:serine/threonine protein kinase
MKSQDVEQKDLRGKKRFKFIKVLANTLQGRIYLSQDKTGKYSWVAVKETWKHLVRQGISRNGTRVSENFSREKKIHLYLSNLPQQNEGYVRCIDEWETEDCYYLAMEFCEAGELFDFIRDNHTKGELCQIVKNVREQDQQCQVTPNEWSVHVQSMFRQMVSTVSWMHSHGVAHLDLSLENTMLASVNEHQVIVKLIDFGLAKHFKLNERFSEKVGKEGYMAPEVYAKKGYLPEKADIWCLGVMLYMMLVGASPYAFPGSLNSAFRLIISGRLRVLLEHWKILPLVPVDALDVMEKIFKPEDERISMHELKQHQYVKLETPVSNDKDGDVELNAKCVDCVDSTDVEMREEGNEKLNETSEIQKTWTISSDLIPVVKTKLAKDVAWYLRCVDSLEKMRTLAATIQQAIQYAETSFSSPIENPKAEGVVETNNDKEESVCELKKLLQVVTSTLENNTTM